MHVLLLAFEFYPIIGGAGTNATNLARGLAEIGLDVDLLTYSFDGHFESHDAGFPFRVIRMPGSPPKRRWEWFSNAARLYQWLRQHREHYDFVVLTDWISQVLTNMTYPLLQLSYASIILGSEINAFRNSSALRFFTHRFYEKGWAYFCISMYTRQLLLKQFPVVDLSNVHVLPVPVFFPDRQIVPSRRDELRHKLGLGERDFVLFELARVVERKGHRHVLEALAMMTAHERAHIRYVVGGQGGLLKPLQAKSKQLGIYPLVKWLGYIPNNELPAYYDACDVFIMPSVEIENKVEGFGIVFLEAAMRGKASIGTHHGAVPEVIIDGITGLLARAGDSTDLLEKILAMYSQPGETQRMGMAAERRAKSEFACNVIAERLVKVYNERKQ
jgi:phosphatidylinositol alpha-1,6-mannosyltransferase